MQIQIKSWLTSKIIYETEAETLKEAVEKAVKEKINLSNADLSEADLSNANLSDADLSKANLSNADLSEADLSNADLWKANLTNAKIKKIQIEQIIKGLSIEVVD